VTVKWGIIGCGDVANRKGGPALYNVKGSELLAVMARDPKKAKAFAAKHGAKRYYGTVEALLGDADVDAVYVATPPNAHCQYTIQAARAGKHVLCEKPMAMSVKECRMMIEACKGNDVRLMVAYYRRGYPNVQRARDLIERGTIGDVVLARTSVTGYYDPLKPEDPANWRADPKVGGGGVLMDMGCHYIDLLLYLLGDVSKVKALVETIHCHYPVEDAAELILKFKGGAHGLANFNWNVGVEETALEIYGIKGKMSLSPAGVERSGDLSLHVGGANAREEHLEPIGITHLGIVRNFVEALANDGPLLCAGEEGIKTNEIIEAAYNVSEVKT
jgi:1,5-anhydro-D-fructose reductase (1,5-anhydro-D-mannitol-forming)